MGSRIVDAELEQTKRDLQRQIGRRRRRIDRRIRATQRETRRLLSWRSYVKACPGNSVMAALGVGLALSAGLSGRRLSRWLGLRLIRRAADNGVQLFWQELGRIWTDSAPGNNPSTKRGADDERA